MAYRKITQSGGEIALEFGGLTPKQKLFTQSRAKYTAYGGARGGGKTHVLRVKALMGAVHYPGIRILIIRREYPELEQTVIIPMRRMIPDALASYNGTMHAFFFSNGSMIKFGHYGAGDDLEYQGQEYDWIFMDEATQFTEAQFRTLGACLRGTSKIPRRMYLTCNPKTSKKLNNEEDFSIMRKYKREFNVYKIVNDVDDKVYIGSTTTELWHRMSQHKAEAKNGAKSPLYDLMREYGPERFRIHRIMSSNADNIRRDEERVILSIPYDRRLNYKRRSVNDTSCHYDYDEICDIYRKCESQNMTAKIIGCSTMTVKKALKSRNVKIVYPPHTAHYLTENPSSHTDNWGCKTGQKR